MIGMRKALLIGLDCAAPELMFHRFIERLPRARRLVHRALHEKRYKILIKYE